MNRSLNDLLYGMGTRIVDYIPNLLAGVVLVGVGWLLGWLAKRVTVQMLVFFRFDRLLRRFRWGSGLGKADLRYAVFETLGNAVFAVVFLILLNAAFQAWKLGVLSNLIQAGVLYVPRLIFALIVFGLGWIVSEWVGTSTRRTLAKESIPRSALVGRFVKGVLLLTFSAMALAELGFARIIVVIGYGVSVVTLSVLSVVAAHYLGKSLTEKPVKEKRD
jgi:hypothetical protein